MLRAATPASVGCGRIERVLSNVAMIVAGAWGGLGRKQRRRGRDGGGEVSVGGGKWGQVGVRDRAGGRENGAGDGDQVVVADTAGGAKADTFNSPPNSERTPKDGQQTPTVKRPWGEGQRQTGDPHS